MERQDSEKFGAAMRREDLGLKEQMGVRSCKAVRRPRLLLVSPVLPFPLLSGQKNRIYSTLRSLAAEYAVTFITTLSYREEWAHLEEIQRWCEVLIPIPAPNRRSALHRVAYKLKYTVEALRDGYDLRDLYDIPSILQHRLVTLLHEHPFDVLLVEYWHMARNILDQVPEGALTVIDTHDVQFLRRERLAPAARRAGEGIARSVHRSWLRRYRSNEIGMLNRFDLVVAISPYDAEVFRSVLRPGKDIEAIPTGVDVDYFTPGVPIRDSQILIFVGAMRSGPNVDAALYLHREIFPHVKQRAPSARLFIVGNDPAPEVQRLHNGRDVVVTGFVEDMRPYYEQAQVVVLPLRKGSGLKSRILEAMAMKLPVVTTPNGIEGIDHIPGENVIVAGEPEECANWAATLLQEPERARRLGEHARQWVVNRYSMQWMGDQFLEAIRKRLPKRVRTPSSK